MSGGAGPASPTPVSRHAQSDLCGFPSPPSESRRGGVAALGLHLLDRGCSHKSGIPGLGYSLRQNK